MNSPQDTQTTQLKHVYVEINKFESLRVFKKELHFHMTAALLEQ